MQHCLFYCRLQGTEKHIMHAVLLLWVKMMMAGIYVFMTHLPKDIWNGKLTHILTSNCVVQ